MSLGTDCIVNPPMPLWHTISGGLKLDKMIEIRGRVPYGADVFHINFTSGEDIGSKQADRLLHISVRFNKQVVVRNSLITEVWGPEDKNGPFPFFSGKPFIMLILVEERCYKIAVDGQHRWEFYHRIDFNRAKMLYIDGAVKIDEVKFFDKYIEGQGIGTCMPPPPMGNEVCQPVMNPSVPFYHSLPDGLRPSMMINISGRPSASAEKFSINFQCGSGPYPPPDIAFHIDARFYKNSVVRNSRVNNSWQEEETFTRHFPFSKAVNFDMIIRVEHDRFIVAINGESCFEFMHRLLPLTRINTFSIEHDVILSSVRFSFF